MRPSSTRLRPRPDARRAAAAPALLVGLLCLCCLSCVTTGTYEDVLQERDDLLTERTALQDRVRALETVNRHLESSNESLTSERLALIANVEKLRSERDRLTGEVTELQRTKEKLGGELDRRQGQLDEREALLVKRAGELAELNARLDERDAELRERQEEISARDREIERLKQSYEAFVADLEAEIAHGQIRIDQLREGILVNLPDATFFAPESVDLTLHGKVTLAKVAAQLRPMTHQIEVQGHTDDLPPPEPLAASHPSNWEVAGARATAVVRQLVAHGIAPERIRAVSYGSARPLGPNDTEAERERNRRIEIRLIPDVPAPARPLATNLPPPSNGSSEPATAIPASGEKPKWTPDGEDELPRRAP